VYVRRASLGNVVVLKGTRGTNKNRRWILAASSERRILLPSSSYTSRASYCYCYCARTLLRRIGRTRVTCGKTTTGGGGGLAPSDARARRRRRRTVRGTPYHRERRKRKTVRNQSRVDLARSRLTPCVGVCCLRVRTRVVRFRFFFTPQQRDRSLVVFENRRSFVSSRSC